MWVVVRRGLREDVNTYKNVARMIINRGRSGTESLRKGDLLLTKTIRGNRYMYYEYFEDGKTIQKYCGPNGSRQAKVRSLEIEYQRHDPQLRIGPSMPIILQMCTPKHATFV